MKTRTCLFCALALFAGLGTAFAQVTASQIYNGLVSYWPMDEFITNGNTVYTPDVVSGINLVATNNPTIVGGVFGNAISLNGTSQYLVNIDTQMLGGGTNNLPSGLPYFAGTPFTVAFWVQAAKPTTTTHYMFTMANTLGNDVLYCLQSGSTTATEANLDVIIRQIADNPVVNHSSTTNVMFDGNWHHFAWVDSNGVVSVYLDGALEYENTSANSGNFSYFPSYLINPSALVNGVNEYAMPINTTCFGQLYRSTGPSSGSYFAGTFDDAAIWNRALSQAEIQYVMSNSITQPVPSLPPSFAVPLTNEVHNMGDYVVLSANVCGTPPLSLQWYENGAPIPGATGQTLDLYNLTTSGTNTIYAIATNPNGSATNGPINLVVNPDPTPDLSVGCYGYWPMDTVNVTNATVTTPDIYDGNNFNLANMTANNLVPGVFDNALDFDNLSGSSTNYAYLDGIVPAFSWTNYTISFWVNAPANTVQNSDTAFGNFSSSSSDPLLLLGYADTTSSSSNLCVFLRSDQDNVLLPYVVSSNGVFDGTWHHVTWVDQGGSVTLYVDGQIDPTCFSYIRTNATPTARETETWTFTSEALATRWENKASSDRLNCDLDDVAWWNRPLSYTEVQMLQTNPVPAPQELLPPVIAGNGQPASVTNAYTGDTVTFTVTLSSGSSPLTYQWYYTNNDTVSPISAQLNASAGSASLSLTDVQLTNDGYYFAVVSNSAAPGSGLTGGGVATTTPAQLIVNTYTPATNVNQAALQLEFNAVSAPTNVQPGFQSITLDSGPTIFSNAVKVTISSLNGGTLSDRIRPSSSFPTAVTNNPPYMTTAAIYNSFIFNSSSAANSGIDVLIQHLAPNTVYGINIWSFDPDSADLRVSDWTEAISGAVIYDFYSFDDNVQPTNDWQDTFGNLLTSDPNGNLDIQGTQDPDFTSYAGVFLNALVLTVNPEPVIQSAVLAPDGNLLLTAAAQYSGETITFQESPDLVNWQNASDGINATQNGPVATSEFPLSANKQFYRVVCQP